MRRRATANGPTPANDGLREQMRHADAAERRRLIDQQRPWFADHVRQLSGGRRRLGVRARRQQPPQLGATRQSAGDLRRPDRRRHGRRAALPRSHAAQQHPGCRRPVAGVEENPPRPHDGRLPAQAGRRLDADHAPAWGAVQRAPQHAGVAARAGDRRRRAHRRGGGSGARRDPPVRRADLARPYRGAVARAATGPDGRPRRAAGRSPGRGRGQRQRRQRSDAPDSRVQRRRRCPLGRQHGAHSGRHQGARPVHRAGRSLLRPDAGGIWRRRDQDRCARPLLPAVDRVHAAP